LLLCASFLDELGNEEMAFVGFFLYVCWFISILYLLDWRAEFEWKMTIQIKMDVGSEVKTEEFMKEEIEKVTVGLVADQAFFKRNWNF
jgi:hypothetical protein